MAFGLADTDEDVQQDPQDLIDQALGRAPRTVPVQTGTPGALSAVDQAMGRTAAPPGASPSPALNIRKPHKIDMDELTQQAMGAAPAPAVTPGATDADAVGHINRSVTGRMPVAPPQDGTLDSLITQRANAATPLNPRDKQYRMGIGQKVIGTAANALRGFGGYKGEPIDVSSGATNRRFDQDTATQQANVGNLDTQIGQREKQAEENRKNYADVVKQAYESQIGEARQTGAEATKDLRASQKELGTVRAQAEADKNTQASRAITYDPQSKRFMQGGKPYSPKTIEEGASLEAANNVEGKYSKLWGGERKNQPAPGPRLNERDQLRVNAKARELGKDPGDLSSDEINDALKVGGRGAAPPHTKDRQTFEEHWNKQFSGVEGRYDKQRAAVLKQYGLDKPGTKMDSLEDEQKADVNGQLSRIEANRAADKSKLQQEKDTEADQYGVYKGGAARQPTAPGGAPARPASQPAATDTPPSTLFKEGETKRFKDKQTGKISNWKLSGGKVVPAGD